MHKCVQTDKMCTYCAMNKQYMKGFMTECFGVAEHLLPAFHDPILCLSLRWCHKMPKKIIKLGGWRFGLAHRWKGMCYLRPTFSSVPHPMCPAWIVLCQILADHSDSSCFLYSTDYTLTPTTFCISNYTCKYAVVNISYFWAFQATHRLNTYTARLYVSRDP